MNPENEVIGRLDHLVRTGADYIVTGEEIRIGQFIARCTSTNPALGVDIVDATTGEVIEVRQY